ncbi:MAG: putative sugar nucleotidyl transferase [Gemmatimonadaceae bacterium]
MNPLFLFDDAKAREFEPFSLTRPVSELRAGAEIIRARWERVSGLAASGFFGAAHLANFDEAGAPGSALAQRSIPAGTLLVNSRCVVALDATLDGDAAVFSCNGVVCAVRTKRSIDTAGLIQGTLSLGQLADTDDLVEIAGNWLDEVWDLVGYLDVQLATDIPALHARFVDASPGSAVVLGPHGVHCEEGANIEPFVVLDASSGPIMIRRGATISSFSRIVGPCYIGSDTTIVGDAIRGCSIGDVCKVRGEMSGSVMLGHSNKGHTGFVGSSYIGRWVNLGAGTTTSNLKNTYGPVQLVTAAGLRDTGLQFLGSLIGDHAKTGIGSMLTTGCTVGAGANVFGSAASPKWIPPFAWGAAEPYGRYDVEKFARVAERMMSRRHVVLSDKARQAMHDSYQASESTR